jgi:signal transduction histidine kinase
MRFYTTTTLFVFAAVCIALFVLQRMEKDFFEQSQTELARFFAKAQADLARRNEQAALGSLLAVHEASHLNLTRLVANTMWDSDIAPLVARAQRLPVEACRALPSRGGYETEQSAARRDCFTQLGRGIRALPGFDTLDRKAYAAMRASTVFKMKVFDLRGITVYSSEHAQVGEDASANMGWKSAVGGRAATELTHRDRFSAFERVVENRDLISSYVPVRASDDGPVVGVFELYSDVTPFLQQIQDASKALSDNIAANQASLATSADANLRQVSANSNQFLLVVGGLLALLYVASLLIVRIGQQIIDRQARAQAQAAAREQLWHREKMAALSTMAASVSHEVGNPLTVISCIAQMLPDNDGPDGESPAQLSRRILEQTNRIAGMMRKITAFAAARSEVAEWIEINPVIEAVCDFHSFDRRFRRKPIEFIAGAELPACELVPDHLNEVMMNLLQACADVAEPAGAERTIRVTTAAAEHGVRIDVDCYCPASGAALPIDYVTANARFELIRRRLDDMQARVELSATRIRIELPITRSTSAAAPSAG